MKRVKCAFAATLWLLPAFVMAQDVITTTEGTDIQGKVFKITKRSIKYIDSNTADTAKGVLHTIAKKDVFSVKYESGVKEVFNQDKYVDDNDPEGHWDKRSMSRQGREDARKYYRRYKPAKRGTVWAAIVADPVLALIPAISCSTVPPKDENLDYPDEALMKNEEYATAYKKEAYRMKVKKIWGGYILGTGIYAAIIVIVLL